MAHHTPFKSLSPLSWETDIAPHLDDNNDASSSSQALASLLTTTFADAAILIDSIPSSPPSAATQPSSKTRARSKTDSAVGPPLTPLSSFSSSRKGLVGKEKGGKAGVEDGEKKEEKEDRERDATVAKLRSEWKEVTQGDAHGISVYKMIAKDGKGAWFARRSLHLGGGKGEFEKWEAALRREMQVTLGRVEESPGNEPGTGNIRGIGAERRVDGRVCEGGSVDFGSVVNGGGPRGPSLWPLVVLHLWDLEFDSQLEHSA
ncbi:hypothetical protein VTJ49DRAFT_3256 [Mycothermus thermophilus]|uniref:Uncharacterized protein n=1 Tax=Humicola insolens TaxID=85995 RepID=A0ABR3V8E5_HUMIN